MSVDAVQKNRVHRLSNAALSRALQIALNERPFEISVPRISELAGALIEDALREHASDIHLDPRSDGHQVRLRIDGALVDTIVIPREEGEHLVRAFKSNAEMDPTLSLRPQDGRTGVKIGQRFIAARIASAPTVWGEKLAIRLHPADISHFSLDMLGLNNSDRAQLMDALENARGMVLISGPTGSGKTTTAYALLHELRDSDQAIVTIEDPVEYVMEGVTQIQVQAKQGVDFIDGVKALLRLDPDVIFMGEMRDRKSARAAIDAADSGHLLISTLHARDAAGALTALRNFGLEDHEIAATLDTIVAQRLVRRLCDNCRRQEPPNPEEKQWLQSRGQRIPALTWHRGSCAKCAARGYRGRIGIFEVYRLREEDADRILQHADEHTFRRQIRQRGSGSLIDDNLAKVAEGITTIDELRRMGAVAFLTSEQPGNNGDPLSREIDGVAFPPPRRWDEHSEPRLS